ARDGYLQPVIDIEILQPSPEDKAIAVRVDRGPETRTRLFAFDGNDELPSDLLEEELVALGLEEQAWTSPEVVVPGLERLYQSQGFLTVSVDVGDVTFEGD